MIRKLRTKCKLPVSIINWIVDFLSDRSQKIKLAAECFFMDLCPPEYHRVPNWAHGYVCAYDK